MKGKSKGVCSLSTKLGFPAIFLSCSLFFLAGFYASVLLSHGVSGGDGVPHRPMLHELAEEEGEKHEVMLNGETGESFVARISFQVLSWKPRALYFPRFASPDQCQSIIKIAKSSLVPSTLALRNGETAENTKGIRTSSGTFISASEDKTGILDIIERKIARVTMIPRSHGEAFNILRYEIGQRYNSHYDVFNPAEYGPQRSQRVNTKQHSIIPFVHNMRLLHFCCTYQMWRKVERPCFLLRMV